MLLLRRALSPRACRLPRALHPRAMTSATARVASGAAAEGGGRGGGGGGEEEVRALLRRLSQVPSAVCFDVDSTVCVDEGIDVLAESLGQGEAVARLTREAMQGDTPFRVALQARLDLIRPSREDFRTCVQNHPPRLSDGVQELVGELHDRGVHVYLVSGGFRLMIAPIAEILGIPEGRVYANTVFFNEEGRYAGFDENEPTSADGGKPAVAQALKDAEGYESLIMIGDGATDMQAKPPADAVIGYGGVVRRKVVEEKADWFVCDMQDILDAVRG